MHSASCHASCRCPYTFCFPFPRCAIMAAMPDRISFLLSCRICRCQIFETFPAAAAAATTQTGLFSDDFLPRVAHLADALLSLAALSDYSEVFQLLPDATRCTSKRARVCVYVCV